MIRIAVICNDRLALPALNQLLQNKLVIAVGVTDRVNETQLLVKQMCAQANVPLQQFAKNNFDVDLNTWLLLYKPDVVFVKTFPWRIAEQSLAIPKHGFINFHYAPLPQWRGSNPLFWMIRNRATTVGVSVHKMDKDFDTGDMLLQQQIPLSADATFGLLCTQLAYMGAELTGKLVQAILTDTLKPQKQDDSLAKWYGRPKPSDLFINWSTMSTDDIKALTKACNPWNKGVATSGNGWTFGVTDVSIAQATIPQGTLPGTIIELDENNGLLIACADNRVIKINIMYCEEGFYSGHQLSFFGFQKGHRLS
jgi:methionyl-tRNA formyltransferase